MFGEAVEHLPLPGPLLEHLRGRLDEIPHGVGARGGGQFGIREQVMEHVAELVKIGDDLVVGHRLPGFGEVADQRCYRCLLLSVRQPFGGAYGEHRGVLVLVVTRREVEIELADGRAIQLLLAAQHVHLNARVPDGLLNALVLHAVHLGGHAEQAGGHAVYLEVLGELVGIQLVLAIAELLVEVIAVRRGQRFDVVAEARKLALELG